MYGEVEKCNWEAECVRIWDDHTEMFDSFPPEEQQRLLEEAKEREERKQREKNEIYRPPDDNK